MQLDDSVSAVVTGGASGLGAATVRALRARGVKVAIFDMNDATGAATAQELGASFFNVDITSEEQVDAGFAAARAVHGHERVLVNCAGLGRSARTVARNRTTGQIERYPTAQFERILQINTVGTFRCITASAAGMLTLEPLVDGERGAIVNTASVAAEDGQIGQVAYAASKAALVGMTLPIARDLASEGIRINTVLPGIMATPPMMGVRPDILANLSASVPFPKRLGHPHEFADLVLLMLTNGYFNGEHVRLDGAIRMPPR